MKQKTYNLKDWDSESSSIAGAFEEWEAAQEPVVAPPRALPATDPVNHPDHYTSHPSGIEAIEVTAYMGFCLGNAMKYIWRADHKGNAVEDLRKAIWYIQHEIDLRLGGRR